MTSPRRPFHRSVGLLPFVALAMSACSTSEPARLEPRNDVKRAVQQPLRDLSLLRSEPPPTLRQAAAAPYALPQPTDCRRLADEISTLDTFLGPDVDAGKLKSGNDAEALLAGAVGGLVDLPFSGIVRRISGAEKRERLRRHIIITSIARRSFLKGAAEALACPPRG